MKKLRGKSRPGLVPPLEDLGMGLRKYPDREIDPMIHESGESRLPRGTPIDISSYFCNQLIIIHLVGVKGRSGRKKEKGHGLQEEELGHHGQELEAQQGDGQWEEGGLQRMD